MEDETSQPLPASEKRALIGQLLGEGLSQVEIGRRLGLSKATISYHARRLGLPAKDKCARRYDWEEIQRVYDDGVSMRECARRFGFATCTWREAVKRGAVKARPTRMSIEQLLVSGRSQTNRSHLKQRLLEEGLKTHCCERCGLTEWRGKPLSMALHHVNGDGKDNRLSNLELLCPNCHAQTENFAGRNNGNSRRKRQAVLLPSPGS
jgi:transposase-like protein